MKTLTSLLNPYNIHKFLAKNWTQEAVFISGLGQDKFKNIFSWSHLNHFLNFTELDRSNIELALEGKILTNSFSYNENIFKPNIILNLIKKGATLKLISIQKTIPSIYKFISNLRQDIGYDINVNAYYSWPEKQAYNCHYDSHEIFILQIEGTKKWEVLRDTFKYPLVHHKSIFMQPPEVEPYLKCTLSPGDILYIPRGHWHYAQAFEEPSLHLTVGVNCASGISFLEWVTQEIHKNENWRKNLPLYTMEDNGATLSNYLETLIKELIEYVTNDNLKSQYFDDLIAREQPYKKFSLPYQVGFNIFEKGIYTKFYRSNLQRIKILEINPHEYKVNIWNKEVYLKNVNKLFVSNLFNREIISGLDVLNWLPDLDWEREIVPILTCLVREEIIFVDSNDS